MLSYKIGEIISIDDEKDDIIWGEARFEDGSVKKIVNYNGMTGNINIGDKVVLNTTATELSLGTGGQDFVIINLSKKEKNFENSGHIMKLRYTPLQIKCLTVEEEDSQYHNKVRSFKSLDGHIVIVATLHSMLAPIAADLKYRNEALKINFIMTDDAALPASFSKTVSNLKNKDIIDNVITTGHAFGGDYECVNVYTGLITSKEILDADVSIIAMGPGIVGTSTKYGFTGINQAYYIDIANKLGGRVVAVPRISFADKRERHQGISHHTLTSLGEMVNTKFDLVMPILDREKNDLIDSQLKEYNLYNNQKVIFEDGSKVREALDHYSLNIKTMGRGIDEDQEFFEALGAVAKYTCELINKECNKC